MVRDTWRWRGIERPHDRPLADGGRGREQHRALDEYILEALSTRTLIQAKDLHWKILASYGKISRRIIYRHLSKLARRGLVECVRGTEDFGANYPGYYRLPKRKEPGSEDPGSR